MYWCDKNFCVNCFSRPKWNKSLRESFQQKAHLKAPLVDCLLSFNYNWEDYKPGIFGHQILSYIDASGSFRCLIPRDKPRTKLSLFVDNFQNQIGHIFFFPELQPSRSPSHFTRIFFIFSRAIMAQGSQAAHGIRCIPINFSFVCIRIPNLQFISVCVFSRVR